MQLESFWKSQVRSCCSLLIGEGALGSMLAPGALERARSLLQTQVPATVVTNVLHLMSVLQQPNIELIASQHVAVAASADDSTPNSM